MNDVQTRRARMVRRQIAARGVADQAVLDAMSSVAREAFLSPELAEFAYRDTPLPIPCHQTISQPYVVGYMAEALQLTGGERVLEIGTGSGYSAAILACIAREVFTVERHAELAETAAHRLDRLGYTNVRVLHGDGTLGWAEHAPFDGILVTAGGPDVPQALREQLATGGRLVIPVGRVVTEQSLVRVTRRAEEDFHEEDLGGVRFVPLIGAQGWSGDGASNRGPPAPRHGSASADRLGALVRECAAPFSALGDLDLAPLLERIGSSRVVLLGESTHGTSEFTTLRARITRALVEHGGFRIVAIDADDPDVACMDRHVRGEDAQGSARREAFTSFPAWKWRNREVLSFVEWLREHNAGRGPEQRVALHGLDVYCLHTSIRQILDYLDAVDPRAAHTARERYACLTPWESDPAAYGRAASHGLYRSCEHEAAAMLLDMLDQRLERAGHPVDRRPESVPSAGPAVEAASYYRALYQGGEALWNRRAGHLFETLEALLEYHGEDARAVVWAHNAQVGDARATEFGARGQLSLGQLAREALGEGVFILGQGTDQGALVAAHSWDGPAQECRLRPAHASTHERVCRESGLQAFLLPLRHARRATLSEELSQPRLERTIGVVYRPSRELASHTFHAVLPRQFDEFAWIAETSALRPLSPREERALPASHPFSRLTAEMVG